LEVNKTKGHLRITSRPQSHAVPIEKWIVR